MDNKILTAHRLSYEMHIGEVHDGLFVLHRCDNRKCINPDHLFLGTNLDNIEDMRQKGRAAWRGKTRPAETNAKISATRKASGWRPSAEHLAALHAGRHSRSKS